MIVPARCLGELCKLCLPLQAAACPSPLLRFAWGLLPGLPAKVETGAEPTDIILR